MIRALPERFRLAGAVSRDAARRERISAEWGAPAVTRLDELVSLGIDAAVVAVAREASPGILEALGELGVPVLAETPPAPDVAGIERLLGLERRGLRVRVAEQYRLEPLVAAQLEIARSGLLGRVTQARVSLAHDYHGMSVLRLALGAGDEPATVRAHRVAAPVVAGPSRAGDPSEERVVTVPRTLAWLDFGDRLGEYDFDGEQYRSWIRTPSLELRGDRGQLRDGLVDRLAAFDTPVRSRIERLAAGGPGSHEGLFLRGYAFEGRLLSASRELPRLAEDEIALARTLEQLTEFARGGEAGYPLREALRDERLVEAVERAIAEDRPVVSASGP